MTESTSEYKKRIEEIKQSIENEPYMAKMREDIAEGISKTGIRQATVEEQFQSVIDETTGKDVISAPEIILARGGATTLGERLDSEKAEVSAQLAQKLNHGEVSVNDIDKNKGKFDQTYMTDEFLQQITGDTPINAVPAKASITQEYLATKAINEYHTDFLTTGKNLIDKDRLVYGSIGSHGSLTTSENYYRPSYFIEVLNDKPYIASHETTFAWYDSSYDFIRRDFNIASRTAITSPSNAKYLMVSFFWGYRNVYQLEQNSASTVYESYNLKADKLIVEPSKIEKGKLIGQSHIESKSITELELANVSHGKNYLNMKNVKPGLLTASNDGITGSSTYVTTTNYMKIEPSTTYHYNRGGVIVFYDENLNYVSGVSNFEEKIGEVLTPPNAEYFKMSINVLNTSVQFEKGTVETSYEKYKTMNETLELQTYNFKDGTIPISAIAGDFSQKESRYPNPARITPEMYKWGNTIIQPTDVASDGTLYAVRWDSVIYKSTDGVNWENLLDCKPFFIEENETCSQYAVLCSDTGRLIVCTKQGNVYVSDEEQTELTHKIKYDKGNTTINFGYDKKQNVILLSSYVLSKSPTNQGKEVWGSKDYGETWTKLFDKDVSDMINPNEYHIHDVCYDQYADTVVISKGDMENNQISYSHDWGETWKNVFDESVRPLHPTSFLVFPNGIAMGSDELPEGIYWWERPTTPTQPEIKSEDISYKVKFGKPTDTIIGTFAHKGSTLATENGLIGVMPFRNHDTNTEGHSRLYATGDGGQTWHEIFKAESDASEYKGFFNAILREETDGVYIYATYSQLNDQYIFRARMPDFYKS